jgi:tetratricopeptide (TPR) repeat protein
MEDLQKLVKIYVHGKNYCAAENACIKMLELDPANAYSNLGYIYYRNACDIKPLKCIKETLISEIYYSKALETNPKCVSALNGLAQLYQITGRIDDMIEFYRMSLSVEDSPITMYNLINALSEKRKREKEKNEEI